jgi:hypothetical protein
MAAKAANIVTRRTREVAEAFVPTAEDEGKTLVTRLDVLLPLASDKELPAQMIANLVDNALSRTPVFGVSTIETDQRFSGREDFWVIVAAGSEDETEIRAGKAAGGRRDQRHSARDTATLFS